MASRLNLRNSALPGLNNRRENLGPSLLLEPMRPHARLGHLEPVGLDEDAKAQVAIPGVQVLESGRPVVALPDPADGLSAASA